jgi:hypothetical protein
VQISTSVSVLPLQRATPCPTFSMFLMSSKLPAWNIICGLWLLLIARTPDILWCLQQHHAYSDCHLTKHLHQRPILQVPCRLEARREDHEACLFQGLLLCYLNCRASRGTPGPLINAFLFPISMTGYQHSACWFYWRDPIANKCVKLPASLHLITTSRESNHYDTWYQLKYGIGLQI